MMLLHIPQQLTTEGEGHSEIDGVKKLGAMSTALNQGLQNMSCSGKADFSDQNRIIA